MSTKPMKPLPRPQAEVQIDLNDAETLTCDDCGNATFIACFFLKRLSPIVSPTGEEALIPVQVYSCGNCGKVPDKLMPNDSDS